VKLNVKIKAPAVKGRIAQTRDDAAADIREIGDIQREMLREITEMNDAIAEITAAYQPSLDAHKQKIELLQVSVQTWCEAHRDDLTQNGKTKTANLVTGEVQWRHRPPSVRIKAQEVVIDMLFKLGLDRFLRVKTEVNKDAILADPDAVKGVAGLSIATGIEDFVITPFEQTA
jgi:phage host-nuclease inhibitor protein Gam